MTVFFIITTVLFFSTTLFLAYKSYTFAKVIINVQDTIEESLDLLDERYKSISEILQKPIFFDSLEVRQVVEEIRITRDSFLFIASKLENSQRDEIDDKANGQEEESS